MEATKTLQFRKVDGTQIENVEKYVKDWIKTNPFGKIIIGCDSQLHSRRIKYSIVIAMHYIDKMGVGHGCHLIICDIWEKRVTTNNALNEMPSKLWKEAIYALETAQLIEGNDNIFKKRIEVHLDFNSKPAFKSNTIYTAGIGLLQSAGYYVLGKPYAQIASNCADHFVK